MKIILTGVFVTLLIRFLPFLVFSGQKTPEWLKKLSGTLPQACMGMLVIYFGSMILGKILALQIRHNRHDDYTMSQGASGAICGLIGAYLLVVMKYFGMDGLLSMGRSLASLVIMSVLPGVDGTSHFSCMAMGMVIAWLLMFLW